MKFHTLILMLACVSAGVTLAQQEEQAPAREGMHARSKGSEKGGVSPEMRDRLLKNFDADGDGHLNDEEIAAARKARDARAKRPETETKSPTAEEKKSRPRSSTHEMSPEVKERLLKKFDTNGDGELDETEMEAVRQARHAQDKAQNGDQTKPEKTPQSTDSAPRRGGMRGQGDAKRPQETESAPKRKGGMRAQGADA